MYRIAKGGCYNNSPDYSDNLKLLSSFKKDKTKFISLRLAI